MKDLFMFLAIFFMFLVLFYGNYATFAWSVLRWVKKPKKVTRNGKVKLVQPKCSFNEQLRCCIPVWQAVEVRKALYGSAGVFAPLAIVSIVFVLLNLFVSFVLPINALVMLIAHILCYIGLLIAFVVYAVITADCARMYDLGKIAIVLNIILPNVFCFYIKNNIPHIMLDMRKEKTFEEHDDDTTFKRKSVT